MSGAPRPGLVKRIVLAESRVPCASPEAVIHMEVSRASPGEVLEIIAPASMAGEVRGAVEALGDVVEVLEEGVEDGVYRLRVRVVG